jgi:hypothetical protein
MDKKEYTIEPNNRGEFIVYEWGVYGRNSVLAGQTSKTFIRPFDSVTEALEKYPAADVFEWSIPSGNSFDHLPDWDMTAREEEDYFADPNDY